MNTISKSKKSSIFDVSLKKNRANYAPLTPISFIERTALIYPYRTAVIYGDIRRNWAETISRARKLASAINSLNIGKGDTVSIIAPNIPEHLEAHFGIPISGSVLNSADSTC